MIVAVPARDEAATIQRCLTSIDRSARSVDVPVTIALAADACTDRTVASARAVPLRRARLIVVEGRWHRAGAARAAAVAAALSGTSTPGVESLDTVWIANTDADCVVPEPWLHSQLELRERALAVAGLVDLDPATAAPELIAGFHRSYTSNATVDGTEHAHVHGANLGLCASVYQAVGGWSTGAVVGEDHLLWDTIRASRYPALQTTALTVTTSARTRSRVDGGFATDLAGLVHAVTIDDPGLTVRSPLLDALDARGAPPLPLEPADGRTVVVAPHPDDETLGAGGLIAHQVARGREVVVVAVTDGGAAYGNRRSVALERTRRAEQARALDVLARGGPGGVRTVRLGIADGSVAAREGELADRLARITGPDDLVVAPAPFDWHPDHEACGRAAAAVAGSLGAGLLGSLFWAHQHPEAALASGWTFARLALSPGEERRRCRGVAAHVSQLTRPSGATDAPILDRALLGHLHAPTEHFAVPPC